ncbi:MAG: hypothetical protein QXL86_02210 [Candidatus Aenigmatarchaeota archaeon]
MPVKWIIVAIIGVLLLLFFSSLALKTWGSISSLLEEWGMIKRPNIVKAILCSYYRCTEGCKSLNVKRLDWDEPDPNNPDKTIKVFCSNFCSPEEVLLTYTCDPNKCNECYSCKACLDAGCAWCNGVCISNQQGLPSSQNPVPNSPMQCFIPGEQNKCSTNTGYTDDQSMTICGQQAKRYPVKITLTKPEIISQNHFAEIGSPKLSSYEEDFLAHIVKILKWFTTIGIVQNIWETHQENCIFVYGPESLGKQIPTMCYGEYKCYEELEVKDGKYSIFTYAGILGDKATYVETLS